jgi:hypothetical protein
MSQERLARPTTISVAVALVVATTLVGNVALLFGGDEGASAPAIVIGGISIALHLVGAWGLWNLRRWGWIMTLILNAFDFLAGIPMLFDGTVEDWFIGIVVAFGVVEIAIFVLLLYPTTRQVFRRSS